MPRQPTSKTTSIYTFVQALQNIEQGSSATIDVLEIPAVSINVESLGKLPSKRLDNVSIGRFSIVFDDKFTLDDATRDSEKHSLYIGFFVQNFQKIVDLLATVARKITISLLEHASLFKALLNKVQYAHLDVQFHIGVIACRPRSIEGFVVERIDYGVKQYFAEHKSQQNSQTLLVMAEYFSLYDTVLLNADIIRGAVSNLVLDLSFVLLAKDSGKLEQQAAVAPNFIGQVDNNYAACENAMNVVFLANHLRGGFYIQQERIAYENRIPSGCMGNLAYLMSEPKGIALDVIKYLPVNHMLKCFGATCRSWYENVQHFLRTNSVIIPSTTLLEYVEQHENSSQLVDFLANHVLQWKYVAEQHYKNVGVLSWTGQGQIRSYVDKMLDSATSYDIKYEWMCLLEVMAESIYSKQHPSKWSVLTQLILDFNVRFPATDISYDHIIEIVDQKDNLTIDECYAVNEQDMQNPKTRLFFEKLLESPDTWEVALKSAVLGGAYTLAELVFDSFRNRKLEKDDVDDEGDQKIDMCSTVMLNLAEICCYKKYLRMTRLLIQRSGIFFTSIYRGDDCSKFQRLYNQISHIEYKALGRDDDAYDSEDEDMDTNRADTNLGLCAAFAIASSGRYPCAEIMKEVRNHLNDDAILTAVLTSGQFFGNLDSFLGAVFSPLIRNEPFCSRSGMFNLLLSAVLTDSEHFYQNYFAASCIMADYKASECFRLCGKGIKIPELEYGDLSKIIMHEAELSMRIEALFSLCKHYDMPPTWLISEDLILFCAQYGSPKILDYLLAAETVYLSKTFVDRLCCWISRSSDPSQRLQVLVSHCGKSMMQELVLDYIQYKYYVKPEVVVQMMQASVPFDKKFCSEFLSLACSLDKVELLRLFVESGAWQMGPFDCVETGQTVMRSFAHDSTLVSLLRKMAAPKQKLLSGDTNAHKRKADQIAMPTQEEYFASLPCPGSYLNNRYREFCQWVPNPVVDVSVNIADFEKARNVALETTISDEIEGTVKRRR